MSTLVAVFTGIGLSATAGLRVFVPLFGASLGVHFGLIEVGESYLWIGSETAMVIFGSAMVIEILAYYVPWVDNLLDLLATPLAIVGGTFLSGVMLPDLPLMLEWLVALVLGGGSAGLVQSGSVLLRGASTVSTGGAGNPVVSTGENTAAVAGVSMVVLVPLFGALLVIASLAFVLRWLFRRRRATELPE